MPRASQIHIKLITLEDNNTWRKIFDHCYIKLSSHVNIMATFPLMHLTALWHDIAAIVTKLKFCIHAEKHSTDIVIKSPTYCDAPELFRKKVHYMIMLYRRYMLCCKMRVDDQLVGKAMYAASSPNLIPSKLCGKPQNSSKFDGLYCTAHVSAYRPPFSYNIDSSVISFYQ